MNAARWVEGLGGQWWGLSACRWQLPVNLGQRSRWSWLLFFFFKGNRVFKSVAVLPFMNSVRSLARSHSGPFTIYSVTHLTIVLLYSRLVLVLWPLFNRLGLGLHFHTVLSWSWRRWTGFLIRPHQSLSQHCKNNKWTQLLPFTLCLWHSELYNPLFYTILVCFHFMR